MAKIVTTGTDNLEKLLREYPIEVRQKVLGQAVRRAGNVVKKRVRANAPVGDPNHKPENKPLRDSFAVKVVRYKNDALAMAIVGAKRPEGAHAHLVEDGHRIRRRGKKGEGPGDYTGAFVPGKEFLAPAADQTKNEQTQAIIDHLVKSVEKYKVG